MCLSLHACFALITGLLWWLRWSDVIRKRNKTSRFNNYVMNVLICDWFHHQQLKGAAERGLRWPPCKHVFLRLHASHAADQFIDDRCAFIVVFVWWLLWIDVIRKRFKTFRVSWVYENVFLSLHASHAADWCIDDWFAWIIGLLWWLRWSDMIRKRYEARRSSMSLWPS